MKKWNIKKLHRNRHVKSKGRTICWQDSLTSLVWCFDRQVCTSCERTETKTIVGITYFQKLVLFSHLTTSWYSNSSRPIIVEEAQFITESLECVRWESIRVLEDYVMSWAHGSLINTLRDQKEIVHVAARNFVVNDVTRIWILMVISILLKETQH